MSNSTSSNDNADLARVKAAALALSEHFDSVQIFVTRYDSEDGTVNVNYGCGNWFARRGQAEEWLRKEDERTRLDVRRQDSLEE